MTAVTTPDCPIDRHCLTPEQRRIARNVFSRLLPHAEVWIFGSRATGRARPFSDLDLLVRTAEPLRWEQRIDLLDAFEQSDLPFRVDIVEVASLEGLAASRIVRETQPL